MCTAYTSITKIPIIGPVNIGKLAAKTFLSHEPESKVMPVACLEVPTMDEVVRVSRT
jgi:hypothetical protein